MGRALVLSDRVDRIVVKDHQLWAHFRDGTDPQHAPCEDLDVVVCDAIVRIGLDTHVLQELARARCVLLATDQAHLPTGMFVPFGANLDHGALTAAQASMSLPRKKQAWKQLVQAKIANQAALLPDAGGARNRLRALRASVASGDTGNLEAQAARIYWADVLPAGVRRVARTRTGVNAALDYGYAVLRAGIARACAGAGLHLGLPFFHSNRANPFALVDDLIEPWRPVVDRRALALSIEPDAALTPLDKRELVGALHEPVTCAGVTGPTTEAFERMAGSVKRYVRKEVSALDLPELVTGARSQ